ncbi:hypothetical protein RIF29_39824 [Crotalaria pallida]|uniref:Uncharacterized protein n=1 Tax=Crotalaria pallida TaxID=3830 RepID=A0AAN9HPY8_CROPI
MFLSNLVEAKFPLSLSLSLSLSVFVFKISFFFILFLSTDPFLYCFCRISPLRCSLFSTSSPSTHAASHHSTGGA